MSIFINYRRNDSADVTGRIYDRLVYSFGDDVIFKDVDSIPFGVNFRTYLNDMIEKSTILLVVIGPKWLSIVNEQGERRLDDPSDYVRIEIEAALKRKIMIVPLLVSGASMPTASQLPSALEELAFYNGIQVRPDPDFHKDMSRLIHELGTQIKPSRRGTPGGYYSGSESPANPALGDILDRPPIETLSRLKGKAAEFVHFLRTTWGRFFIGLVSGGIASLLMGGLDFVNFVVSGGILGLIIYPHRKTVSYLVYGVILAIITASLAAYILRDTGYFDITLDTFLNISLSVLFAGILLGVIVSRIQHIRKKI